VTLEHIEATAIRQRLDVAAARKQVLLMANAVSLATTSRLTGLVQVGVHVHQDPDGPRVWGPTLDLELPIFDQRQAVIGRLEAQQRQAQRQLAARSITARSEVRVARARLLNARQVVERYRTVLLPLRERVVEQSQLQYNGMQIGLYELLAAKQGQVEAYRAYLEALQSYWVANAALELAAGGALHRAAAPTAPAAPATQVKPLPNESKEPAHGEHAH
jgi:cobalt-zinc-cadmium efflux system outer membrane protein